MANDDRQSDQFIREVDEEIRREQLKTLWERFGIYIIVACVAVVAITGGYRGWIWWQGKVAADRGDRFIAASTMLAEGDAAEATTLFEELQSEGGSYGVLAQLRLAGVLARDGNRAEAIAAFNAISADSSVDSGMRDLARIRSALLMLDQQEASAAAERVADLATTGNPWRHAAREIQATAAYMDGNLEQARDLLLSIEQDAVAPNDARQRAALMLALVNSLLPDPTAGSDDPDDAGGASGAPPSSTENSSDAENTETQQGSGSGG